MSRYHIKKIGRKYKVYWFNELSETFRRRKDAVNHAAKLQEAYIASLATKPKAESKPDPEPKETKPKKATSKKTAKPKQSSKPKKIKQTNSGVTDSE